jgi:hypothetical protein
MVFDRHIVRSMVVTILAIIAYIVPFAVEAHEGHVHCASHKGAVSAAPAASAPKANTGPIASSRSAGMPVKLLAAPRFRLEAGRSTASLRADDAHRSCCPGVCKRCCCGTMVCGTFGIVAGPASLPIPVFRAAVQVPHDATGHAGIGPEGLRRPPRTLA